MSRRWYWGRWGPLGAAETAVKLGALMVAIAAAVDLAGEPSAVDAARQWGVLVLLGIATFGLVGAIADRVIEREITAMIFVVVNVIGHVAAILAVLHAEWPRTAIGVFAVLMTTGELIKLRFLRTTGFRVRDISPRTVVALTTGYAALYAVIAVLVAIP